MTSEHLYNSHSLGGLEGHSVVTLQNLSILESTLDHPSDHHHHHHHHHQGSLHFEDDDEDDVFQCGRCKKKFRSLDVFFNHKREECSSLNSLRFRCPVDSDNSNNHNSSENTSLKTVVDLPTEFITSTTSAAASNSSPGTISFEDTVLNVQTSTDSNHSSPSYVNSLHGSSIIHLTPSMIGSDTVTFSIPVDIDQHGSLTHIVNSSQLLSVPDNDLHSLMNSDERYHLSTIDHLSNSISSHGLLLTASLVSSSDSKDTNLHVLSSLPAHIHLDEHVNHNHNHSQSHSHSHSHNHSHHIDPSSHSLSAPSTPHDLTIVENMDLNMNMNMNMNMNLNMEMDMNVSMNNNMTPESKTKNEPETSPNHGINLDNHDKHDEDQITERVSDSPISLSHHSVLKCVPRSGGNTPENMEPNSSISDTVTMTTMTMNPDCSINEQVQSTIDGTRSNSVSVSSMNSSSDGSNNEAKNNSQETINTKLDQSNSTNSKKCQYCGKSFKKVFNLQQHLRSHTGETPFYCLVCGRGFTQKSNVKKHMQTHKVWPKVKATLPKEQISVKPKESQENYLSQETLCDSNKLEYIVNNVYVCQYCDASFPNHHKLKTHMTAHKNEKLFKCINKDCTATFIEVDDLLSHIKNNHEVMEYNCQKCFKVFNNLYELGAHQYTHRLHPNKVGVGVSTTTMTTTKPTTTNTNNNTARSHKCSKCNSKYSTAESLNHHLLTSSHKYPCTECGLIFVCERYLRRHLKIHGTGKSFKCTTCNKSFKTENYLKSHLVIHSAQKPYSCDVCKAMFNRRDKLSRHKRIHENRKKYKCPFKPEGCTREFYRKDKLKDHLLSHTKKTYICAYCDKSMPTPTRLRHHQIEFHPETLASTTCNVCKRIFKTHHHLKIHLCKGPPEEGKKSTGAKTTKKRNSTRSKRGQVKKDENDNEQQSEQIQTDSNDKPGVIMYGDCDMAGGSNYRESPLTLVQMVRDEVDQDSGSADNDADGNNCVLTTMDMGFEAILGH